MRTTIRRKQSARRKRRRRRPCSSRPARSCSRAAETTRPKFVGRPSEAAAVASSPRGPWSADGGAKMSSQLGRHARPQTKTTKKIHRVSLTDGGCLARAPTCARSAGCSAATFSRFYNSKKKQTRERAQLITVRFVASVQCIWTHRHTEVWRQVLVDKRWRW